MVRMRIDEALFELGNIVGHDTLIKDNANEPAPIEGVIGEIVDSVGGVTGLINDVPEKDYAINEDGIYEIREDGFIDRIPLYRVVRD